MLLFGLDPEDKKKLSDICLKNHYLISLYIYLHICIILYKCLHMYAFFFFLCDPFSFLLWLGLSSPPSSSLFREPVVTD